MRDWNDGDTDDGGGEQLNYLDSDGQVTPNKRCSTGSTDNYKKASSVLVLLMVC